MGDFNNDFIKMIPTPEQKHANIINSRKPDYKEKVNKIVVGYGDDALRGPMIEV